MGGIHFHLLRKTNSIQSMEIKVRQVSVWALAVAARACMEHLRINQQLHGPEIPKIISNQVR